MDIDQIRNFVKPWGREISARDCSMALRSMLNSQSRRTSKDCVAEFASISGESEETIRLCAEGKVFPTPLILSALKMHQTNAYYALDEP